MSFGISHESGELKRVLVHHPGKELEEANRDPITHHFECAVNVKQFQKDHMQLMNALKEAGVEVIDIGTLLSNNNMAKQMISQAPNLVFTRDSSSVTDAGAILFNMGLVSRRRETPIVKMAHETLGIPIAYQLSEPDTLEGGGFALLEGRVAAAGLCDRSTQGALDSISKFLLNEHLVDLFIQINQPPDRIHIDGEFAELPGKRAIAHRESLDAKPALFTTRDERWEGSFMEWLFDDGYEIIEINDKERLDMAANFLTVKHDLCIHYTGNDRVMKEVRNMDIEVIQIPGDEMKRGCGGIHCMTCPILRI